MPEPSYVLCHDLMSLPRRTTVFRGHVGKLTARRLVEVEDGLRAAYDL